MNNNPANMSNEDLENDMKAHSSENNDATPVDNANTSEDPEVKPMEKKSMDMGTDFEPEKEQDLDDLIHQQDSTTHNGNGPDPETLKFREGQ